jgi:hypothetical protein
MEGIVVICSLLVAHTLFLVESLLLIIVIFYFLLKLQSVFAC